MKKAKQGYIFHIKREGETEKREVKKVENKKV
jgi:hypothetical protein